MSDAVDDLREQEARAEAIKREHYGRFDDGSGDPDVLVSVLRSKQIDNEEILIVAAIELIRQTTRIADLLENHFGTQA